MTFSPKYLSKSEEQEKEASWVDNDARIYYAETDVWIYWRNATVSDVDTSATYFETSGKGFLKKGEKIYVFEGQVIVEKSSSQP